MYPHETVWANMQPRPQWPATMAQSSEILSQLPHQGVLDNGREPNENGVDGDILSSPARSSQSGVHSAAIQQPMRPPPMRPRTAYDNVYALPFTQNLPKMDWNIYGLGVPLQSVLSSEYALSNKLTPNMPLEKHFDESHLLENIAAFPDLDTDPNLVAEMLASDDSKPDMTTQKPDASLNQGQLTLDTSFAHPLFGSPFSLSSNTASFGYSDFSAYSEVPSYASDFTPCSSVTFSSTPLSPVPSPRVPRTEAVRSGGPSHGTSSPRGKKRAAPSTLEGPRKRWSTGSVAPHAALTNPPPTFPKPNNMSHHFSSPSTKTPHMSPALASTQHDAVTSAPQAPRALLPSNVEPDRQLPNHGHPHAPPPPPPALPLASQTRLPTLQSSPEVTNRRFEHYFELPGPPDLLGQLKEEPLRPPPEDMVPQDPSKMPHEQELRFENDLYTPRWVRGHGNKREGWCGICKPGRWLVLKNSAFWYDKSFTHGISAATGQPFASPKDVRRTEGNANVWEGLCEACGQWVALVSSKKKGTTWFRHAYKCHQNSKPTETQKRRRGSSISSSLGASTAAEAENKSPSVAPAAAAAASRLGPLSVPPAAPATGVENAHDSSPQEIQSASSFCALTPIL